MTWPLFPRRHGGQPHKRWSQDRGSRTGDHITVCEIFFEVTGTTFMHRSHLDSRLFPPAPLTGDVGRGCGDASRALLFSADVLGPGTWPPGNRPGLPIGTRRAPMSGIGGERGLVRAGGKRSSATTRPAVFGATGSP